jgi:3',5'-cyclic AMP phosphodiesterase CpdA
LIITGDLTHIGLPNEFRQAREWLTSVGEPHDVTVIPGNHEAYTKTEWQQTLALWQPYMDSDVGSSDDRELFPSLRIRGPAAIIGICSAIPTAPFLATGRVDDGQLQRLPNVLKEARDQGLFRILVLHHSPVAGVDKWRKRLTNMTALQQVLERQGVELVLHGHSHRTVWSNLSTPNGTTPVICTPSGSAIGHKPERWAGYHRYRLEQGMAEWKLHVEMRTYSPQEGIFSPHGDRCLSIPRP